MKLLTTLIVVLSVLIFSSCGSKNSRPDLRETYSYNGNRAFDTKVAYKMVRSIYKNVEAEITTDDFLNSTYGEDYNSLYIIISKNFYTTANDRSTISSLLESGNTVFISSNNFDSVFLAQYALTIPPNFLLNAIMGMHKMVETGVRLKEDSTSNDTLYSYFFKPVINSFDVNALNNYKVGFTGSLLPNMIVTYRGKGTLILHNEPKVLGNYFLLRNNNFEYFKRITALFPANPQYIYWDNYYNSNNFRPEGKSNGSLSAIMKYPPLRKAFWVALATILLFVLFNGKRRQRIIPDIPKNKNSSVQFAEAIAGLYLDKKDNNSIAHKMVVYFHDWVRSRFMLITNNSSPDYINKLAQKAGKTEEETVSLYKLIDAVAANDQVTDEMLLELNERIQNFIKNK